MANEIHEGSETLYSGARRGIVGHIKALTGGRLPAGWLPCDGAELLVGDYPALFAVIGARFGGDGVTTFALPDLPGEHRFAICFDGYFPLESSPPAGWKLADEDPDYIEMRARAFKASYAQGVDPFGRHLHASELDPEWLKRQAQVLVDAYGQDQDPLSRHLHVSEIDPEWLERQAQVMQDAYTQGRDPLHRHPHVSEVDPEWLERQAQVLEDAYDQGHDPHVRHPHLSELDPEWLERQAQVMKDAYDHGADPLHRHPHLTHLDPEWLDRQAQVLIDAYQRHSHPLDPHPHVSEVDPEWLERQARVLTDAYDHGHDPHEEHPPDAELDQEEIERRVAEMIAAYARGEDPLAVAAEAAAPDDLKRIEGIGPKIAGLLQAAGIATFAQLAETEVEHLRQILVEGQIRGASPLTWPEQARLAATGKWDELAALQDELKGGRRV